MKELLHQGERVVKLVFVTVMLLVIGHSIASTLKPYPREGFNTENSISFTRGWEIVESDGSRRPLVLPDTGAKWGEDGNRIGAIVLERRLPETIDSENCVLFVRSMHQDITMAVDGEEVYRYTFDLSNKSAKGTAPELWLKIPIRQEYAGKNIRLRLERYKNYPDDPLNEMYLGEEVAILYRLVLGNLPQMTAAVILILLGTAMLLEHGAIRKVRAGWMGGYLFLLGLWVLTQCEARQLFFQNTILVRDLEFIAILLVPIPALETVNELEKRRYQNQFQLVAMYCLMVTILSFALILLTDYHYLDFFPLVESGIVVGGSFILFSFFELFREDQETFRRLRPVFIAHVALVSTALFELFLFSFVSSAYQGAFVAVGAAVFGMEMLVTYEANYSRVMEEKRILELSEKAKSDFLASMSHEIRTPMNTVLGMNELILRESHEDRILRHATDIKVAGQGLLSIINEILEFSRIESGKVSNVEKPFDFGELIHDIVTVIRFRAEQKGLVFKVEIEEDVPLDLMGNSFWLREIITNLLDNAVKYTEAGGVFLTIKKTDGQTAKLPGAEGRPVLQIMVKDTGIGIKDENQGLIFRRFERDSSDWKNYIQGTGLGLAITKHYIESLKGRIALESRFGFGSLFTVYIPVQQESERKIGNFIDYSIQLEDTRRKSYQDFRAPDARVLLVDDNELNRRLMLETLRPTALQTDVAENGEEALRLLHARAYDLVFLDDLMPGMSGMDVLKVIRGDRMKSRAGVAMPVVIFTANAMPGMKEQYLSQGFDAYLPKPADQETIGRCLLEQLPADLIQRAEAEPAFLEDLGESTDLVLFDREVGLKYCMNDESIYREILEIFCDSYEERAASLQESMNSENWESYEIAAHSLKTSALTIGAMQLSDSAKKLEMAAKAIKRDKEKAEAIRFILLKNAPLLQLFRESVAEGQAYLEREK